MQRRVDRRTRFRQTVATLRRCRRQRSRVTCDFIAGCDGFHGISRPSIPASAIQTYDREYPFAWLGILSESPPIDPELVYVHHPDGFALFTMRSNTVSRLYLQVAVDEDIAQWSDDRIWSQLHHRLEGDETPPLIEGPVLQKSVLPMRSFMTVPMRFATCSWRATRRTSFRRPARRA
jgi:p-hydroxybenzoate 3-monooxygenase